MTLRVLTWNVWWRNGPWEAREAAIAAVLAAEGADVVCLQEAWTHADGGLAARLASCSGYAHWVAPHTSTREVGLANAVLSRWPIAAFEVVPLPDADGAPSPRTALHAEVDAPFGRLPVVSTHLHHRFDGSATRVAQATALARLVAERRNDPAEGYPTVVGADLNAVADSDELRLLTGRTAVPVPGLVLQDTWEVAGDGAGWTWSPDNPYLADAYWPRRRLDYVLVSWPRPKPVGNPVQARLAGTAPVGGVQPSDHFAVVVDLVTP